MTTSSSQTANKNSENTSHKVHSQPVTQQN